MEKETIQELIEIKRELLQDEFSRIQKYEKEYRESIPNLLALESCWRRYGSLLLSVYDYCALTNKYFLYKIFLLDELDSYDKYLLFSIYKIENDFKRLENVENNKFFKKNKDCCDLFSMIKQDVISGSILGYTKEEKSLAYQCIMVPFSIYQNQQKDSHFLYSNRKEYLEMKLSLLEFHLPDDDKRIVVMKKIIEDINRKSIWYKEREQCNNSTKKHIKK